MMIDMDGGITPLRPDWASSLPARMGRRHGAPVVNGGLLAEFEEVLSRRCAEDNLYFYQIPDRKKLGINHLVKILLVWGDDLVEAPIFFAAEFIDGTFGIIANFVVPDVVRTLQLSNEDTGLHTSEATAMRRWFVFHFGMAMSSLTIAHKGWFDDSDD
jgi:hypothetical protein